MNDAFPLPGLPPRTTIDVWLIELDLPLNPGVNLDNILSVDERNRAGRFAFVRDASRFRVCRAMLRLGLAWYLEKAPQEIALTTRWRGKPCLADCSTLNFNVTHSHGLGLIAFTTVGEVGIDVEAFDRRVEALDIATASFTRNEASIIGAAATPQEQAGIFLRFWTRKEAVLKAAGCGILRGLDTVDVSQPGSLVSLGAGAETTESHWLMQDLEVRGARDGFCAAVAARPGDWSVQQWPIRCEDAIHRIAAKFPGVL
jgi:4'-phosphopantetheinyl transferase